MSAATTNASGDGIDLGAAASPLPPHMWRFLAEGVLRDAKGSLLSARKLAKRLDKASKQFAPAGTSPDAVKAAARAFVESEASSAHSSGRGDFLAVAADDPISLAAEASRKTKKKKKKKKRKGEDDDDKDDDDDDNSAEKSLSKAAKKAKKKHKKRAEAEATTDLAAAAAVLTPPPPPQPQTPAAAARQLHFPAPVTLASHRIPSGESAPQAAAAASAAAAAPETLLKWRASAARPDVKKGRLSSAEKEALVAAAKGFARSKGLSIEDLSWLFETRTGASRGLSRGAWNAIAAALPQRTAKSVYAAGTRLLHPGNYKGAWTSEEISRLRELVSQRGNRWAEIGGALGRLPEACRDRWKELGGSGSGSNAAAAAPAPAPAPASPFNSKRWAPDEVERLERAVRSDLAMKAAAAAAFASDCGGGGGGGGREEEAPLSPSSASRLPPAGVAASVVGARAVLDGVNWSLVSSRGVKTRSPLQCMEKWYSQVSPSMLDRGDWGRGDDKRMLRSLLRLYVPSPNSPPPPPSAAAAAAANASTVDWARVAPPGRTAAATKRRWHLMLKTVRNSHELEFAQAVEEIARRSAPKLLLASSSSSPSPSAAASAAAERGEGGEEEQQEKEEEVEDQGAPSDAAPAPASANAAAAMEQRRREKKEKRKEKRKEKKRKQKETKKLT